VWFAHSQLQPTPNQTTLSAPLNLPATRATKLAQPSGHDPKEGAFVLNVRVYVGGQLISETIRPAHLVMTIRADGAGDLQLFSGNLGPPDHPEVPGEKDGIDALSEYQRGRGRYDTAAAAALSFGGLLGSACGAFSLAPVWVGFLAGVALVAVTAALAYSVVQ
jgi:hypothetical protein